MEVPSCVPIIFAIIATVVSVFYALGALAVFTDTSYGKLRWQRRIHEFWLNLLGSAVGWVALWMLIPKAFSCLPTGCGADVTWADASIALIAFIGITGHIPYVVVGFMNGFVAIGSKGLDMLKSVVEKQVNSKS